MAGPRITLTCDCGRSEKIAYGEPFVCDCGRRFSTDQIPPADYAAIKALDRRYRVIGWATGLGFALIVLFVMLTRPATLLFLLPGGMMAWFALARPLVRRRHYREVKALTREWEIKADA